MSPSVSERVRIVQLDPRSVHALANGDLATANSFSPVPLTPYFTGPEWRELWRMRSDQLDVDPTCAPWITGALWDEALGRAVGRAGFHGPPDPEGMVEVGYAVDPQHRRRGYARAALVLLLRRAEREPGVRTVRASIRPDNVASRALVEQYGFVPVGEQWDEADGWETVFERSSRPPPADDGYARPGR